MNYDLYSNIFGIVLAALLLTIFEIFFFNFQVAPTISRSIQGIIKNFGRKLNEEIPLNEIPESLLESIEKEEAITVDKYNEAVMYNTGYVIGGLGAILVIIAYLFKGSNEKLMTKSAWFFVIGSFILFALFQVYFFYEVSLKYNYPTTQEAEYIVNQSMLNTVNANLT